MLDLTAYIEKSFKDHSSSQFAEIKREYFYLAYSYKEVWKLIQQTITFLRKNNISKGDRLMIWAANMPEWPVLFIACILEGVVVVPASTQLSEEIINKYVEEVKPKALFRSIYQTKLKADFVLEIELEYLFDIVRELEETRSDRKLEPDHLVEILYTSGTTGEPKGVMLTHKNFASQLDKLHKLIKIRKSASLLSLLPYSHIYEQVISLLFAIGVGAKIYYVGHLTPVTIRSAMREYRPTHLVLVPEVMKTLLDKILYKVKNYHLVWEFNALVWTGRYLPKSMRRFFFAPVLGQFGGKLEMVTLGGAKTDKRVQEVFSAFGVDVIEGYGLTETTGPVTMNIPEDNFLGTSGRVIAGADIKLNTEQEVMVRGDVVSPGYYKKTEKNKESFDNDGYFFTGDIAQFDENNCLIMQGRQKFRIVLANGEKVYPEDIEHKLSQVSGIKEACVFAFERNGTQEVAVAVILENGSENLDIIMAKANERLEISQRINHYVIWPQTTFPRTATLKIRRSEVAEEAKNLLQGKSGTNDKRDNSDEQTEELKQLIKIISLVCQLSPEKISASSKLAQDLKVDSLKRLSILTLIEEEFGVDLDESKIDINATVDTLQKEIKHSPKLKSLPKPGWQFWWFIVRFRQIVNILITRVLTGLFVAMKVYGWNNIKGQAIYVSNHPGVYDFSFIVNALDRKGIKYFSLVADKHWANLFNKYSNGMLIKILGGAIPLDQKGKDIQQSLAISGELIRKGFSLILAPHGEYTYSERDIRDIQDGSSYIAKNTDLPIIPCYISDNYGKIFNPKSKFKYLPRPWKRQKATLVFGESFRLPSYLTDEQANKIIADKILELKNHELTNRG